MCRGGPTAQAGLERARWAAVREHRLLCVHHEPRAGPPLLEGPTKTHLFSPDIRARPQDFSVLLGQDLTQ